MSSETKLVVVTPPSEPSLELITGESDKKKKSTATKTGKLKMVRDSFTMPADDYSKLDILKSQCLENGIDIKKSELLRAGLIALSKMPPHALINAVKEVEKIKTGRPKGN